MVIGYMTNSVRVFYISHENQSGNRAPLSVHNSLVVNLDALELKSKVFAILFLLSKAGEL